MAYKFSVGAYTHSGSLSATSDITGSTIVSGSTGTFGSLTVASFSPANISSTNITASSNMSASTANFGTLTVASFSPSTITTTSLTATTGSFTTVSGTFVDFLTNSVVPNWDDTNGRFANSAITSNVGG